jgi:hypothetical protein
MLTPFGVAVRKLRLDKRLRLLDFARLLNRSAAFCSAVETGRKPVPPRYVVEIGVALHLTASEVEVLRRAEDQSKKEVRLEGMPASQRELVAAFARKVDELPADVIAKLKEHVFKSEAGETPFKRQRKGIVVPPLSNHVLRAFSEQVRSAFVAENQVEFPIMDVLEFRMEKFFAGFYVDVVDRQTMGGDEGRVIAGVNAISLREDVYEAAWAGNGRARFTACHELGHFLMHREVTLARTRTDSEEIFRDSEWQADTFAGNLLMSCRHLSHFRRPEMAAERCGMTPAAARVMWSKYKKEGLIPT